jgi:hypothetical protein
LEKDVLAVALRALHGHGVFVFAQNVNPRAAEITSPAQQQPPETRQCAPMPVNVLHDRFLLYLGRIYDQGNSISAVHVTILAPQSE